MLIKLFRNGNSQAVKIPKEMQFRVKEVEINHIGNSIITKLPKNWQEIFAGLENFSDGVFEYGREQPKLESREALK